MSTRGACHERDGDSGEESDCTYEGDEGDDPV